MGCAIYIQSENRNLPDRLKQIRNLAKKQELSVRFTEDSPGDWLHSQEDTHQLSLEQKLDLKYLGQTVWIGRL